MLQSKIYLSLFDSTETNQSFHMAAVCFCVFWDPCRTNNTLNICIYSGICHMGIDLCTGNVILHYF